MSKIKKVNISNSFNSKQLQNISFNLANKYNCSVKIAIDYWTHNLVKAIPEYTIAFVPGLNDEECTTINFNSWITFQNRYFSLMEGD